MKHRLWINVALLAAVIVLALVAYFKPQGGVPEHRLSVLKTGEADRIQVQIAGAEPIELQRTAADWLMTAPVSLPADNYQILRLLGILEATSKDRFAADGLARYELSEPYARLTINKQTFSFGAVNQMSREQYVMTQESIYPVSLRYGAALPKNALQLAHKGLFTVNEAPVAFEFRNFKLVQQDSKWQLTPPSDVGADDVTRWVDEWRLAAALEVLPAGGRKPLETISIKLRNGKDISVAVLQHEPALVLARSDQNVEYQFSGTAGKRLLAPPSTLPPPASAR